MRQMTDMRRTPEEKVEAMTPSLMDDVAEYPPGLSICLDQACLDKLNLDDDVEIGDMIHCWVMAKVSSVSKRSEGGEPQCRIELQITHMGVEDEDKEGYGE